MMKKRLIKILYSKKIKIIIPHQEFKKGKKKLKVKNFLKVSIKRNV
jgi:hypothetical protein